MAISDNRKLGKNENRRIRWMRAISILLTAVIFGWMVIKPWAVSYSQGASPNLVVTPLTWDIVGLDSVDPTQGPTRYMIGAQICNEGTDAASGINALLKWSDSVTTYINSGSKVNIFIDSLAVAACQDVYYTVNVNTATPQGTTRGYTVEVTTDTGLVSTFATPHQIFVERDNFNPSGGLSIAGFSGIGSPVVGQQYRVVMTGNAALGMQQFENLINFPTNMLTLDSVTSSYQIPAGTAINGPYADACGWESDPTITTTYRTCIGPAKIGTGTISGQVVTTYTFSVNATGAFTLTGTLYGFVNDHYYYNGDYGQIVFNGTAVNPTATPTATSTGTSTTTPTPTVTGTPPTATPTLTLTPTGSGTPATPTSTGTILPNPGVTKGVSPSSASNGGLFTFTIKVVNTGSAPATNVTLTDSFSAYTYLDIYNLTTTAGTTNVSGRVATVTIGTLMPNQSVTVTLTIYVNSNATSTTYPCNSASISYSSSLSRVSNTVCYTVYGTATLPGTGENPRQISGDFATSIMSTILLGLVLLAVLFLTVKIILYIKPNLTGKARLATIAAVLFILATVFVVVLVSGTDWSGNSGAEISLEMTTETAELSVTSTPTATINPLSILPAYLFATPGTPGPIETLPSYPVPTPSQQPTQAPGEKEPDTTAIKRIVIPALNLDTVVAYVPFDGHTWMIQGLRQEVAWLGNTSWPGLGGNTALAAHVTVQDVGNGPFRFLFNLKQGDEVLLYTEKNVYTYHVSTSREVEMTDLSVTEKTDNPQVTLITCVEWNETLYTYTSRYVVTGALADVTPIVRPAGN